MMGYATNDPDSSNTLASSAMVFEIICHHGGSSNSLYFGSRSDHKMGLSVGLLWQTWISLRPALPCQIAVGVVETIGLKVRFFSSVGA